MPSQPPQDWRSREVPEALNLIIQALELLEDNKIAGEIGAHLDFAILHLSELLGIDVSTR